MKKLLYITIFINGSLFAQIDTIGPIINSVILSGESFINNTLDISNQNQELDITLNIFESSLLKTFSSPIYISTPWGQNITSGSINDFLTFNSSEALENYNLNSGGPLNLNLNFLQGLPSGQYCIDLGNLFSDEHFNFATDPNGVFENLCVDIVNNGIELIDREFISKLAFGSNQTSNIGTKPVRSLSN